MPRLSHPENPGHVVEVSAASVAMYESQGWRKVTPKPKPKGK